MNGLFALKEIEKIDKKELTLKGKTNDTILHRKWLNERIAAIEKDLDLLDLILSKQVDIWLVNQCDYQNYVRIRKQSLIDSKVYCDDGVIVDNQLTKEEFDFIKEIQQDE